MRYAPPYRRGDYDGRSRMITPGVARDASVGWVLVSELGYDPGLLPAKERHQCLKTRLKLFSLCTSRRSSCCIGFAWNRNLELFKISPQPNEVLTDRIGSDLGCGTRYRRCRT